METSNGVEDLTAIGSVMGERTYEYDGATYREHPAATIFPLLDGDDFRDLVEDVRQHGLRDPVILLGNEIVDGRNRFRAAMAAGVPLRFEELPPNVDPVDYVMSRNNVRRHLTPSQRSMSVQVARRLKAEARARGTGAAPTEDRRVPDNTSRLTLDQAATAGGVSRRSSARAATVSRSAPDLEQPVIEGHITVADAARICKLPVDVRHQAVEDVKAHRAKTATAAVRQRGHQVKVGEIKSTATGEGGDRRRSPVASSPLMPEEALTVEDRDLLPPRALVEGVRLALDRVDVAVCATEAASTDIDATSFCPAAAHRLSQPWPGSSVYALPPIELLREVAVKLLSEIEIASVTRAALLMPLVSTEDWLDRLLAHADLLVIARGCTGYRRPGTEMIWSVPHRMALLLFGVGEPSAEVVDALAQWGHVSRPVRPLPNVKSDPPSLPDPGLGAPREQRTDGPETSAPPARGSIRSKTATVVEAVEKIPGVTQSALARRLLDGLKRDS